MTTKHPERAATVPVLIRLTPRMLALVKETEAVIGLDVTGYVRRAVWESLKSDGYAGPTAPASGAGTGAATGAEGSEGK